MPLRSAIDDPLPILVRHLREATVELFAAYDLPASVSPDTRSAREDPFEGAPDAVRLTASIGYTGQGVRGSLIVVTSVQCLSAWAAATLEQRTDDALCDALGEFANMLLGRLKNRLLMHAVVLSIALPTTSIGTRMRVFAASNAAPWMRFDTAQGSAWVRLDVSLGPEFSMASDQTVPPSGALPEGDMLLF